MLPIELSCHLLYMVSTVSSSNTMLVVLVCSVRRQEERKERRKEGREGGGEERKEGKGERKEGRNGMKEEKEGVITREGVQGVMGGQSGNQCVKRNSRGCTCVDLLCSAPVSKYFN